jgi:hypothetical protein
MRACGIPPPECRAANSDADCAPILGYNAVMNSDIPFTPICGLTVAVLVGLALYALADLVLDPHALADHVRPPKGGARVVTQYDASPPGIFSRLRQGSRAASSG